jgi:hypothetical protein
LILATYMAVEPHPHDRRPGVLFVHLPPEANCGG